MQGANIPLQEKLEAWDGSGRSPRSREYTPRGTPLYYGVEDDQEPGQHRRAFFDEDSLKMGVRGNQRRAKGHTPPRSKHNERLQYAETRRKERESRVCPSFPLRRGRFELTHMAVQGAAGGEAAADPRAMSPLLNTEASSGHCLYAEPPEPEPSSPTSASARTWRTGSRSGARSPSPAPEEDRLAKAHTARSTTPHGPAAAAPLPSMSLKLFRLFQEEKVQEGIHRWWKRLGFAHRGYLTWREFAVVCLELAQSTAAASSSRPAIDCLRAMEQPLKTPLQDPSVPPSQPVTWLVFSEAMFNLMHLVCAGQSPEAYVGFLDRTLRPLLPRLQVSLHAAGAAPAQSSARSHHSMLQIQSKSPKAGQGPPMPNQRLHSMLVKAQHNVQEPLMADSPMKYKLADEWTVVQIPPPSGQPQDTSWGWVRAEQGVGGSPTKAPPKGILKSPRGPGPGGAAGPGEETAPAPGARFAATPPPRAGPGGGSPLPARASSSQGFRPAQPSPAVDGVNPWRKMSPWSLRGGDVHAIRSGTLGLPQLLERIGIGVPVQTPSVYGAGVVG